MLAQISWTGIPLHPWMSVLENYFVRSSVFSHSWSHMLLFFFISSWSHMLHSYIPTRSYSAFGRISCTWKKKGHAQSSMFQLQGVWTYCRQLFQEVVQLLSETRPFCQRLSHSASESRQCSLGCGEYFFCSWDVFNFLSWTICSYFWDGSTNDNVSFFCLRAPR